MELDEIIERILSSKRNLTRKEILQIIEDTKGKAMGYLTDEGAAHVVAAELGIKVPQKSFQPEMSIRNLVSGLNDVTVKGQVISVYPSKTFIRQNHTEGKVSNLYIQDGSGTLKVTLWDDKVKLVEDGRVKQGDMIKIFHGYIREGINGKLEIHIGSRGKLELLAS